jgi:hypothetical protein
MNSTIPTMLLLVFFCGNLLSCKKDSTNENNDFQTTKQLLARDTLIYDEQILNWKYPSQKTSYKRGQTTNTIDLDNDWTKYEIDGSFTFSISNILIRTGEWELLDHGKKLHIWNIAESMDETFDILKLTKDTFEFSDPSRYSFYRQVH